MFRHEKYVNKYSAMFVHNSKVGTDQILGRKKKENEESQSYG
jgi:hypothetical protein